MSARRCDPILGRTWRNPLNLPQLIRQAEWPAAVVLVDEELLASLEPTLASGQLVTVASGLGLCELAESAVHRDGASLQAQRLLRGWANAKGQLQICFDIDDDDFRFRAWRDGIACPDVEVASLAAIARSVRRRACVQRAFPRQLSIQVALKTCTGAWSWSDPDFGGERIAFWERRP